MTTTSETKSRFEQLLSKIYARWPCQSNQKVCIDCLKRRSNKNNFECENCGCTDFMCSIIKILHILYPPVCNV